MKRQRKTAEEVLKMGLPKYTKKRVDEKIDRTPRQWVKFEPPSPEKMRKRRIQFMKDRQRRV